MGGMDSSAQANALAIAPLMSADPAIQLEQLCRHYRMGETLIRAVDGVTLSVRAGEFVALLAWEWFFNRLI